MKSILALTLLMLFAAYINCQTCGAGQLLCGASCYFPSQYVCLAGNRLCPIGHLACGAACYLPSQFHCVGGILLPGPAPQATESIVTAPSPGVPGCPPGNAKCGTVCYDPILYDCLAGNHLCPKGLLLCGIACYSPLQYHCVGGVLQPGPAPQVTESIVTGGSPITSPAPCGTGEALCGAQCYVTANYFCTTGNHLCPCGARCFCPGDGACFNPTVYSCCSSAAFPTGHLVQGANKCTTATNKAVCTGVGCV